jgi:hypothetical protein
MQPKPQTDMMSMYLGRLCQTHARLERLIYMIRYQLEATDQAAKFLPAGGQQIRHAGELPAKTRDFLDRMKGPETSPFLACLKQITRQLEKPSAMAVLGASWQAVKDEWAGLSWRMEHSTAYRNHYVHSELMVSEGRVTACAGDPFLGAEVAIRASDLKGLVDDIDGQFREVAGLMERFRPLLRGDADSRHVAYCELDADQKIVLDHFMAAARDLGMEPQAALQSLSWEEKLRISIDRKQRIESGGQPA